MHGRSVSDAWYVVARCHSNHGVSAYTGRRAQDTPDEELHARSVSDAWSVVARWHQAQESRCERLYRPPSAVYSRLGIACTDAPYPRLGTPLLVGTGITV